MGIKIVIVNGVSDVTTDIVLRTDWRTGKVSVVIRTIDDECHQSLKHQVLPMILYYIPGIYPGIPK
jgi:hypothetical protein